MKDGLLSKTLISLAKASFDKPRLFIDGHVNGSGTPFEAYPQVVREPALKTAGNWVASAYELYIRDPHADRYAIFQDDMVTGLNLRQYLDRTPYPGKGYLNLFTFPINALQDKQGFYESPKQNGKGAVALVFDNDALRTLLASKYIVDRFRSPQRSATSIDGGIVSAMKEVGYKEYVHNPSLVQHIGDHSSMGHGPFPKAETFRGEEFDLLRLL